MGKTLDRAELPEKGVLGVVTAANCAAMQPLRSIAAVGILMTGNALAANNPDYSVSIVGVGDRTGISLYANSPHSTP